jgi:hypothetical protein
MILMISGLLSCAVCRAEDGSIQEAKEYLSSQNEQTVKPEVNASAKHHQKAIQTSHYFPFAPHWRNWRVTYYAHAHATPWWPNAPGD